MRAGLTDWLLTYMLAWICLALELHHGGCL
jgi:hypothetical protein